MFLSRRTEEDAIESVLAEEEEDRRVRDLLADGYVPVTQIDHLPFPGAARAAERREPERQEPEAADPVPRPAVRPPAFVIVADRVGTPEDAYLWRRRGIFFLLGRLASFEVVEVPVCHVSDRPR